jgi:adenine-specific DNA-methyltransferase
MLRDNINHNEKVKSNTGFLKELKEKLPEFFTANKFDDEGNMVEEGKFDLEKFNKMLQEQNIEELTSGYQIDFIGKDYAKKQAGEFAKTVIVPDLEHNQLEENKNSKNLFFTGDNLEVLRHLQNNYSRSIDMIYIDPPYNTGTDGFVYPDKFEYSDQELKDMFGMSDTELVRLKSIQGKATHSAWLSFMYPRLWLAKRLLTDEGRIFISIDDNESANLKLICDEIFGEISFVGSIGWESKTKSQNTKTSFDKLQPKIETILVYSMIETNHFNLIVTGEKEYLFEDKKGKYREYELETMSADGVRGRNTMIFDIEGISPPNGMQWKLGKDTIKAYKQNESLSIRNGKVIIKIRPEEEKTENTEPFWGFFSKTIGTAETAKKELNNLMGVKGVFDTVKPSELIKRLIFHSTNKDGIILDFFAGSSTTADAVMQLNSGDTEGLGKRKYIMVQIPEKTYDFNEEGEKVIRKGSEVAFREGYMSIDEVSRERIKKASKKIQEEAGLALPKNFDGGFKHYYVVNPEQPTLDDIESFDIESGLFKDNSGQLVNLLESGFDDMIQPFSSEGLKVSGNATGVDTIVTTWLVKDGYKMDVHAKNIDLDGYNAIYVDNSRLYLIHEKWNAAQTKELLNLVGTNQLKVQTIALYGYSFNLESIRELEIGLKQLDSKVNLIKRY